MAIPHAFSRLGTKAFIMYTGKICPPGVGRTKGEEGIDDDD
jgi:hypothetical protein